MKKIYTCFACGFPIAFEESEVPSRCPGCGAPREQFLEEPWMGSIEKRRIHVDPPAHDPTRDPFDISFHIAKDFADTGGEGRVRRWVMGYDDPDVLRDFYSDVFGWDIIQTEHSTPEQPVLYCATGPGTEDWEPRVPSFGYGFLKPRNTPPGAPAPSFIVEVKSLTATLAKVEQFGGKVLIEPYVEEGQQYAVAQDSEGNQFYLWEVA